MKLLKGLLIPFFLSIFVSSVMAFGFGSYQIKNIQNARPGEVVTFPLYFYFLNESENVIHFSITCPENWVCFSIPSILNVTNSSPSSYIWLDKERKYLEVYEVDINVKVPNDAMPGIKTVKVDAFIPSNKNQTLAVYLARSFTFYVNVTSQQTNVGKPIYESLKNNTLTFIHNLPQTSLSLIVVTVTLSILAILFLIDLSKKKAFSL